MRYLPGEEAEHQQIRDQQAAARFDAERYWNGYDPADDATWEPLERQDCDCGACLVCVVERRTR